jgi:hypothetical protein
MRGAAIGERQGTEVVGAYMGRNLDNSIGLVCIVDIHAHAATSIELLGTRQHHAIPNSSCDWCRASLISPVQRNGGEIGRRIHPIKILGVSRLSGQRFNAARFRNAAKRPPHTHWAQPQARGHERRPLRVR